MDRILVAGVDSVVGGNLAASLAFRYDVLGISWSQAVGIARCRTARSSSVATNDPQRWIASEQPAWVVFCGPGAESAWSLNPSSPGTDTARHAAAWARACSERQIPFAYISSDAVFTGPWMFHRESGTCFCDSPAARQLRSAEREVAQAYPTALIARTNAFGWSPCGSDDPHSLVDQIVAALQSAEPLALDCLRHATPILATDLAELLEQAWRGGLQGLYHFGGGERVNPFRFAWLLAEQFGLSAAGLTPLEPSPEQRRAFGAGETSLQTRRLKKGLETSVPLLREGLSRLFDQYITGYRDRFSGEGIPMVERAA